MKEKMVTQSKNSANRPGDPLEITMFLAIIAYSMKTKA